MACPIIRSQITNRLFSYISIHKFHPALISIHILQDREILACASIRTAHLMLGGSPLSASSWLHKGSSPIRLELSAKQYIPRQMLHWGKLISASPSPQTGLMHIFLPWMSSLPSDFNQTSMDSHQTPDRDQILTVRNCRATLMLSHARRRHVFDSVSSSRHRTE